ncbi:MAG: hypothetical protein ABI661_05075 [Gammaproteobacteria bacterium]
MSVQKLAIVATITVLTAAACGKAPPPAEPATPAAAERPAAPTPIAVPGTVTAALAELAGECSSVDGIPHTDEAVRQGDLNGDGRADFVLFAGWINCENAASIYGDREKVLVVFAGDGRGGAAQAFSDTVFDARLETAAAGSKLWLTVMGESCGRPPGADFASEAFCERAIDWQPGTGRFDYAPVATVRMIE